MKQKLHWRGPIEDGSGYGHVAREYVKWFNKFGWNINVGNITYALDDQSKYLDDEDIKYFRKLQIDIKKANLKDRLFVNHCTPDVLFAAPGKVKKSIAYSVWETDRIPERAVIKCNDMDAIITASEYSKAAFLEAGVKRPIYVIPHIVVKKELPSNAQIEKHTRGKISFLSVFEWHLGKGYDILLKGFIEAYKDDPGVVLILKVNSFVNPNYLQKEVVSYIKNIKKDKMFPKIIPICTPVKPHILYSLYNHCDIYVTTTRREAFGLCTADALMHEKIVIAPNRGGHTSYLNENNAILIKSEWEEIKDLERERRNYKGQKWIESDYEHFVTILRRVRQEWNNWDEEDTAIMKKEAKKLQIKLSPETIIKQFEEVFDDILGV